jgi:hypothetical protein
MKKFHARRILKLADYLHDKVAAPQFDVCVWGHEDLCGTVACVGGWAGLVPEFRRAGLKTDPAQGWVRFLPTFSCDKKHAAEMGMPRNSFCGSRQGCELFFGVLDLEELNLFMPSGYEQGYDVTPKQVARKLREVVRQYHPDVYRAWRLGKTQAA